jgi:hypothetical protein
LKLRAIHRPANNAANKKKKPFREEFLLPRDRVLWALAAPACVALLAAPALWNGFPLLQWDTGGYLARWFEGTLVPSRPAMYGYILLAGAWGNFWPVVALQAALTVWVLHLVLRAHGYGRPWALLGVVTALAVFTTLPWTTAILLTDIFCGLGVLALYLVMVRAEMLRRVERVALIALAAVAGATHSATYVVLLALLAGALLWHLRKDTPVTLPRLRDGAVALVLGALVTLTANWSVSGQFAWTPGGAALSFGRMLQDGIVAKYLDEHCPDPRFKLCEHRAGLPRDADAFFWGSDVFNRLGRFAGLGREMETIALNCLIDYPLLQLKSVVLDTARQIVDVRTGEGVLNTIWHTYAIVAQDTPWIAPAMKMARQQRGELHFEAVNALHYPLALIAILMLPTLIVACRTQRFAALRDLALTVAWVVLANAAVCGVFSNPHDRYGARIVWLASLTVVIAALTALRPAKFD